MKSSHRWSLTRHGRLKLELKRPDDKFEMAGQIELNDDGSYSWLVVQPDASVEAFHGCEDLEHAVAQMSGHIGNKAIMELAS